MHVRTSLDPKVPSSLLSAICRVVFLCLARLPYVFLTDHSASGSSPGSPEVSSRSHAGHFSPVVKGMWAGSKTQTFISFSNELVNSAVLCISMLSSCN